MILRFYTGNDELLAEIPTSDVVILPIGQRVLLPRIEDSYTVIDSIIDYQREGNNFPTYVNVTVVKTKSIR